MGFLKYYTIVVNGEMFARYISISKVAAVTVARFLRRNNPVNNIIVKEIDIGKLKTVFNAKEKSFKHK